MRSSATPGLARCPVDGVVDRLQRDFELEEDQAAAAEVLGGGIDIGREQVVVGALDDEDAVLARGIDEDRRDAARRAGDGADMAGIDAESLEIADGVAAEEIVADAADHQHIGAELRRGDGLVGALAAMAHGEGLRLQRLAGLRHPRRVGHQVDHVAADNPDACAHGDGSCGREAMRLSIRVVAARSR